MSILMDQTWKLNKSVGCDAKCSHTYLPPSLSLTLCFYLYHFRIILVMAKWNKNGNGNATPTPPPNNNDINDINDIINTNMCIEIYLRNLIMIRVNTIVWVYLCALVLLECENEWKWLNDYAPVYNITFGVWFNPNRK